MSFRFVSLITLLTAIVLGLLTVACRDSSEPKLSSIGTYNMGEKAQVGSLIYTVFDSKWELSLGDQVTPRVPTNRFFILNVSVVNGGTEQASIPTFTLIDDEGKPYQELDNGEGVKNWLGFVRRLRPTESAQGTIVFDVPQKRFKLRVANEEERFALVNIPLSLGEPMPDVAPKVPSR
jgi:hypothetical protein